MKETPGSSPIILVALIRSALLWHWTSVLVSYSSFQTMIWSCCLPLSLPHWDLSLYNPFPSNPPNPSLIPNRNYALLIHRFLSPPGLLFVCFGSNCEILGSYVRRTCNSQLGTLHPLLFTSDFLQVLISVKFPLAHLFFCDRDFAHLLKHRRFGWHFPIHTNVICSLLGILQRDISSVEVLPLDLQITAEDNMRGLYRTSIISGCLYPFWRPCVLWL